MLSKKHLEKKFSSDSIQTLYIQIDINEIHEQKKKLMLNGSEN